jgi:ABC-type antimicrobial peptide transport system permease subunit
VAIPIVYNVRNLFARRLSTTLTALGIALVTWVFIFTLALAGGFESALKQTGSPDNAIVIRRGGTAELTSIVLRDEARTVTNLPEIARGASGQPLASPELLVIINIERRNGGGPSNVTLRGVSPAALALRPGVRLEQGRMFQPGLEEIVIGSLIARRFEHCGYGDRIDFNGRTWSVVGILDGKGTAIDSEIWGDVEVFQQVFDRPVFSSVTVRLTGRSALGAFQGRVEADPRLSLQARREDDFYADQAGPLGRLFRALGLFITIVLSLGAVFGALNTMYAAVGSRTKEIGTLLALGFSRGAVLLSFLFESVLLAVLGGVAGCLLSLPVNGITAGTSSNFSELVFRFVITPATLLQGIGFAALMGLVGGFFPARKAAMRVIVEALREA